jgi:hypothetical protein
MRQNYLEYLKVGFRGFIALLVDGTLSELSCGADSTVHLQV